jgi:vancomycin resistance protein VanW
VRVSGRMLARRVVPYRVRLALVNLRGLPRWVAERRAFALPRLEPAERERFGFTLAAHASPLERVPGALPRELQRGKETNVRLASEILDGTLLPPGETFSYHHALGRPSRRRGFRPGLELRDGRPSHGIGGGLCQVSNGLYWTAVQAGMEIVERHRHGLDLFPDHQRTVPFGCGATVLWRHTDLRIRNPLPVPVLLRTRVEGGAFRCELRTETDPGIRVAVREEQHRFFRTDDGWMRENRIRRRITRTDGSLVVDEEVAHNRGRVLYEPSPEQTSC